ATRIVLRPSARLAEATPVASRANHVALPAATPNTSSAAPPAVPAAAAAVAPAKIAAQETIVSGFDAVAITAVANARRRLDTSSSVSPPLRTRKALYSVRRPRTTRTAPPTRPRTTRTGPIETSGAAPATPSVA